MSQPKTKNLIDDITGIFGSSFGSNSQPVKNDFFGGIDFSSSTVQENPQKSNANDLLSNLGAVSY